MVRFIAGAAAERAIGVFVGSSKFSLFPRRLCEPSVFRILRWYCICESSSPIERCHGQEFHDHAVFGEICDGLEGVSKKGSIIYNILTWLVTATE